MDAISLLPTRSIEDILAERVRLTIGGEVYDLPALPIADSEEWRAGLEGDLVGTLSGIDSLDNDIGGILGALAGQMPRLIDALYSYDRGSVLPEREVLTRKVTALWIVRAVLEVWRATNPLVDIGLAGMADDLPLNVSPLPTSSRSRNGVKRPAKSATA